MAISKVFSLNKEHVPVRHGEAGDGNDRPQPEKPNRHPDVQPGVPHATHGQDQDHRAHSLRGLEPDRMLFVIVVRSLERMGGRTDKVP